MRLLPVDDCVCSIEARRVEEFCVTCWIPASVSLSEEERSFGGTCWITASVSLSRGKEFQRDLLDRVLAPVPLVRE